MSTYQQKIVLLTGGNSGIGLAIAQQLAQQGAILHLIARREPLLEVVKKDLEATYPQAQVFIHSQDISHQEAYTQLVQRIGKKYGRIDLLINNAGISHSDYFQALPLTAYEQAMEINYFGSLYGTYAAWPFLEKAPQAQVAFVSSVAGYLGIIGYPTYVPSKFAVTGLAETMRMEGKRSGIQVSLLFPPDTETPMLYQDSKNIPSETEALGSAAKRMHPEKVASILIRGLQKGKFEIYCNVESRLYRVIKGLFPTLYYRIIDQIAAKARKQAIYQSTDDYTEKTLGN